MTTHPNLKMGKNGWLRNAGWCPSPQDRKVVRLPSAGSSPVSATKNPHSGWCHQWTTRRNGIRIQVHWKHVFGRKWWSGFFKNLGITRVEPHFATVMSRVGRNRGGRDYSGSKFAGIAQLIRALAFQAGGCEFESRYPLQCLLSSAG